LKVFILFLAKEISLAVRKEFLFQPPGTPLDVPQDFFLLSGRLLFFS